MTSSLPQVYFYIPKKFWPSSLPDSPESYWRWQNYTKGVYRLGKYNWTLQTYLHLKILGFPCQLIDSLPADGIVIAHRSFLPDYLKPEPRVLIVCIQADRPRHPYAQLHVVQNPQDVAQNSKMLLTRIISQNIYFISNWPQPGLIPRALERGDQFENAAYFGIVDNRSPALELQEPSWRDQLRDLGLNWHLVSPEHWDDYRNIDVVVAVRSFNYQGDYLWKPASKLINAWHAGVPAILGRESAFRVQRKSELDYIEVTSSADAITALKRLRDEPALRRTMVENGRVRAEETQPAKIAAQWCRFLTDIATPAYQRWCAASSLKQQIFLLRRYLAAKMGSHKVKSLKNLLMFQNEKDQDFTKIFWN